MSPFALLSLLSTIAIVFLGNFVYYKDPTKQLNKTFMVFCISCAYWSFTEFAYRQAGDADTARLWFKLGSFWPFAIAILLHFVLVFTGQWQRFGSRLVGVLLYGPALVFSLVDLTTDLISGEPIRMYWGWTYGVTHSITEYVSDIWALSVAIVAVVLCGRFFLRATDPLKKQQAKYITLGLFLWLPAGAVTEVILPWLGIKFPEMTTTMVLVEVGIIAYAIWKYRLFIISAETAAESIIATMSDALLLLSPEGRIQRVNQATVRLLGYGEGELIGQPLAVFGARTERNYAADFTQYWLAKLSQAGLINRLVVQ
jgi:PAS domain-containing protein